MTRTPMPLPRTPEEALDFGKKKKKDKKEKKDEDDEPAAGGDGEALEFGKKKKKDKKEKRPCPIVGEVIEVAPVPKKDKLRLCKVRIAEDADPVSIVTNAVNVVAGGKFLCALPGVTTADGIEVKEAKVGGVDSTGMFCGPVQMGWDTDELDEKLAVQVSDDMGPGDRFPPYEEAVEAFRERQKAAKAAEEAAKAKKDEQASKDKAKKGKKGKAGKAEPEDDDFDALLDEFKDSKAATEQPAAKDQQSPRRRRRTSLRRRTVLDAKTLANRKKKDKKKGAKGAGGGDDDDDFEAALGEFKDPRRRRTTMPRHQRVRPRRGGRRDTKGGRWRRDSGRQGARKPKEEGKEKGESCSRRRGHVGR
ncbi:unnamed protein product [Prorocentrum cordatum]|uniref:tRNA-binding domain-containing protein n=1 Tax=Prorocentrum cordatum TaxID=2364126 RepID=A0ABN9QQF0_9DINO|nr:unnamed protein product [Polarella glacialis]